MSKQCPIQVDYSLRSHITGLHTMHRMEVYAVTVRSFLLAIHRFVIMEEWGVVEVEKIASHLLRAKRVQ